MANKKKFSSRVVESVDPMSAFVDDSEELAIPEDEPKKELFETLKDSLKEAIEFEQENTELATTVLKSFEFQAEEVVSPSSTDATEVEFKKINVLDMLHESNVSSQVAVLEKNSIPLKLQNETAEKITIAVEAPNVGTLYNLLEVGRQYAIGYQDTWDESIRAYARHMGFPAMASLDDCKMFLVKWGAKLKK